ncbi:hypothetical protein [Bacillus massilinigeriensis]|uniref:hypothetical protein n=1 Tax=Bacillus mediterraneensis TaxID=1805474 RepID=UPI0008F83424|nr:hypothetical protein [Bacillus mediterraneensis]
MFYKYTYAIIISIIFLVGCNNSENTNEKTADNSIESEQANKSIQNKSLEKKLLPPKFNISNFEMNYFADNKELVFLMNYEIDVELYEILQDNKQQIYFSLEYPEELYDILKSKNSELLLAEQPKNYKNKYQVQFKRSLDLNTSQLEKIKENISGFNLIIADHDKEAIAHFIDLAGFNNFDPNTSNSIHIDDTTN